jgi:uncharacterized protein (TIGR03382 family)
LRFDLRSAPRAKALRCASLALALLCAGGSAHAFVDSSQFFADPMNPHEASLGAFGEGVYFTGAPRFATLDCSSCHAGGPGVVAIRVTADPPGLFSDGYSPGVSYEIQVALLGETIGLDHDTTGCTLPPRKQDMYAYEACNNNNFALEVDSQNGPLMGAAQFCAGAPSGGLCPAPAPLTDETIVSPNGDAVFGNRIHDPGNPQLITRNDPTVWRFWWQAPAAGTGPLTIYAAAVDGNGGDGTLTNDQDVFGDDTVQAIIPVPEAGAGAMFNASAGCEMGGTPIDPTIGLGGLVLLFGWASRRRRATTSGSAGRAAS